MTVLRASCQRVIYSYEDTIHFEILVQTQLPPYVRSCVHTLSTFHTSSQMTRLFRIYAQKNPLVHRHSVAPSVIGNILLRLPWLDPKCLIEPNNYCYICPPVPYHPIYRTTISPYHSPCNVTHLAALSLHCSLSPTKTTGYGTGYFW